MAFNKLSTAFPALGHRNFRLFWTGQCISQIGTWMQNVAQAWLVLQLTGSPLLLGVITAVQFAPALFLSVFAGVVVDRMPKRRILILSQTILMLQAFGLAALVWLGMVRYWQIVVMAIIYGLVITLDHPARQAFVVEMVGKEHVMNAVALNSTVLNAARVIGPAVAGLLISLLSMSAAFLINALSFVAVLVGLLKMSEVRSRVSDRGPSNGVLTEIKEGLKFSRSNSRIFSTLLLVSVVSIFAVNFNVLIPVFAQQELDQTAGGYGLLMSFFGLGALIGALFLLASSRLGPKYTLLKKGSLALALCLILLGIQKNYVFSSLLLAIAGAAMIVCYASANTTLQLSAPDNLRGRVMSLYSFVLVGLTPIGSLGAGALANYWGAGVTFSVSGSFVLIFLLGSLVYRLKSRQKTFSA